MEIAVIIVIVVLVAVVIGLCMHINKQKKTSEGEISIGSKETDLNVSSEDIRNVGSEFEKEKLRLVKKISELEQQISDMSVSSTDNIISDDSLVKKLQSEVKKLKQDLEDAQDDIDDVKSKSKKQIAQLESTIADKEKETNNLKELNTRLEEDKVDLQNTIINKNTSLEFVQEILTAKSADKEESVRAHHKAVDDVYNFIDGELYSCLTHLYDLPKDIDDALFGSGLEHWRLNERKTWIKGKTSVALIGEFSSGKTSIVNRLLSQDKPNIPLLPVSTKATTAIPTYISGGVSTSYRYYSAENQLKSITEQTFTMVNKEVLDEIKGASQLIKYFVMTYNNPMLNGLSVLDTPGFLSNDSEDTERTIEVINECDALFWVFDVNKGQVSVQSLRIIKDNLTKPLFVIINKIDTKSNTEVDKVEQLLRQTFASAGVCVQGYLRFSQKAPLDTLSSPLRSLKSQQHGEDYLGDVIGFVRKAESELSSSAKELQSEYNQNKNYLDEQYSNYQNSFRENSECARYAASIPHWETHFFSSDKYEMSAQEYDRLSGLLNAISEDTEDTYNKFPHLISLTKETQKQFEDLCTTKANHKQVKRCLDKLVELTKKIQ